MQEYHKVLKKLGEAETPKNREVVAAMVAAVKNKPINTSGYAETPLERATTLLGEYNYHVSRHLKRSNPLIFTHSYFSLCLHRLKAEHKERPPASAFQTSATKENAEVERVWKEALANFKRRMHTKTDPLPPAALKK